MPRHRRHNQPSRAVYTYPYMIDGVRYQALSLTIVSPGLTADCVAEGPAACLAIRWWVEGKFPLGDEAPPRRRAFLPP